jgi:peptidoglycan/LPS O-acetylase OafA/YrhL
VPSEHAVELIPADSRVTSHAPEIDRSERFRPDIEGLRAVAVLLVVLHHAGVPGIGGGYVGVDVFFVISGFLITGLLLRELQRTGRISIRGFYARRFLRLIPAAALVLVATVAASWWWLPPTRFRGIAMDALLTTVYGLNYRLAAKGVDYLGAAEPPTPLQHFWSLAVEEQFYVVWPLLLGLVAAFWTARRGSVRAPLAVLLALIICSSFSVSLRQTSEAAPWAYFGTPSRAWELAAGALVALFAGELSRLPRRLASSVGVAGLIAIIASAFVYTEQTAFPGYAALLPVLGAVAVIGAGCAVSVGPLRWNPMQRLGGLSYSWYLWHWPALLIGPSVLGGEPDLVQRMVLVVMSLGLAGLTLAIVENPLRHNPALRSRPVRGIGLGLGLSASAAALCLLAGVVPLKALPTGGAAVAVAVTAPGAAAERQLRQLIADSADRESTPSNLTPALADAGADNPPIYRDKCHLDMLETAVKTPCLYGDRNATATIVLFGDSHAAQWFSALDAIAKKRHMRLAVVTKSACPAADALIFNRYLKRDYTECQQWRDDAFRYIDGLSPSIVVVSSNDSAGQISGVATEGQDQAWTDAWSRSIRRLVRPGTAVAVIEDTPWPAANIPDCVIGHPQKITACARARRRAILEPDRRAAVARVAVSAGATVIDPISWFCTVSTCPPVVGNLLVYRDESHMTTDYSRALAPVLATYLPGPSQRRGPSAESTTPK